MKYIKVKAALFAIFALSLLFFGNDFSIIDIEKTAIITALGVDVEDDGKYLVTAQIAVPESSDVGAENKHVELSGTGVTVGAAVKKIGDVTGWFPHLSFCNLIVVGSKLAEDNIITVLDYFAKTLRMQDSAMVVLAENSAKDILSAATPLDKTPSFALQKVLFKNPGFDSDIASMAIKTFCLGYYDVAHSGYMPLVKIVSPNGFEEGSQNGQDGNNQGSESAESSASGGSSQSGGSQSGESQGAASGGADEKVFFANTTALFKDGKKVGELNAEQTLVFNALNENITGTTIELENISSGDGDTHNVLITVIKNRPHIGVSVQNEGIEVEITLDLYCKISDRDAESSDTSYSKNVPLPDEVKKAAEQKITEDISALITAEKTTGCDFLKVLQKIYRYHYKHFEKFKDDFTEKINEKISVTVSGQK